jgi:hypothetical protein
MAQTRNAAANAARVNLRRRQSHLFLPLYTAAEGDRSTADGAGTGLRYQTSLVPSRPWLGIAGTDGKPDVLSTMAVHWSVSFGMLGAMTSKMEVRSV